MITFRTLHALDILLSIVVWFVTISIIVFGILFVYYLAKDFVRRQRNDFNSLSHCDKQKIQKRIEKLLDNENDNQS